MAALETKLIIVLDAVCALPVLLAESILTKLGINFVESHNVSSVSLLPH